MSTQQADQRAVPTFGATDQHAYATRLQRLDACAVSDALDKLGLKGTVTGLPQLATARRIAGRVVTVKLVNAKTGKSTPPTARGGQAAPLRHLGTTAIETAERGDVIVVEQRTGIDAGSWGGILSLGASVAGMAGVIADGPVRDIDEARLYDFPVFARGLTAFTARGRVTEQGTNVPITVGDVVVDAGDYVVADNSAVVFISKSNIDKVLAVAEDIVRREAMMAKQLLNGINIAAVMGSNYENMLLTKKDEQ